MGIYQTVYVTFEVVRGIRKDSGLIMTTTETPNREEILKLLRIQHGREVEVLATRPLPSN